MDDYDLLLDELINRRVQARQAGRGGLLGAGRMALRGLGDFGYNVARTLTNIPNPLDPFSALAERRQRTREALNQSQLESQEFYGEPSGFAESAGYLAGRVAPYVAGGALTNMALRSAEPAAALAGATGRALPAGASRAQQLVQYLSQPTRTLSLPRALAQSQLQSMPTMLLEDIGQLPEESVAGFAGEALDSDVLRALSQTAAGRIGADITAGALLELPVRGVARGIRRLRTGRGTEALKPPLQTAVQPPVVTPPPTDVGGELVTDPREIVRRRIEAALSGQVAAPPPVPRPEAQQTTLFSGPFIGAHPPGAGDQAAALLVQLRTELDRANDVLTSVQMGTPAYKDAQQKVFQLEDQIVNLERLSGRGSVSGAVDDFGLSDQPDVDEFLAAVPDNATARSRAPWTDRKTKVRIWAEQEELPDANVGRFWTNFQAPDPRDPSREVYGYAHFGVTPEGRIEELDIGATHLRGPGGEWQQLSKDDAKGVLGFKGMKQLGTAYKTFTAKQLGVARQAIKGSAGTRVTGARVQAYQQYWNSVQSGTRARDPAYEAALERAMDEPGSVDMTTFSGPALPPPERPSVLGRTEAAKVIQRLTAEMSPEQRLTRLIEEYWTPYRNRTVPGLRSFDIRAAITRLNEELGNVPHFGTLRETVDNDLAWLRSRTELGTSVPGGGPGLERDLPAPEENEFLPGWPGFRAQRRVRGPLTGEGPWHFEELPDDRRDWEFIRRREPNGEWRFYRNTPHVYLNPRNGTGTELFAYWGGGDPVRIPLTPHGGTADDQVHFVKFHWKTLGDADPATTMAGNLSFDIGGDGSVRGLSIRATELGGQQLPGGYTDSWNQAAGKLGPKRVGNLIRAVSRWFVGQGVAPEQANETVRRMFSNVGGNRVTGAKPAAMARLREKLWSGQPLTEAESRFFHGSGTKAQLDLSRMIDRMLREDPMSGPAVLALKAADALRTGGRAVAQSPEGLASMGGFAYGVAAPGQDEISPEERVMRGLYMSMGAGAGVSLARQGLRNRKINTALTRSRELSGLRAGLRRAGATTLHTGPAVPAALPFGTATSAERVIWGAGEAALGAVLSQNEDENLRGSGWGLMGLAAFTALGPGGRRAIAASAKGTAQRLGRNHEIVRKALDWLSPRVMLDEGVTRAIDESEVMRNVFRMRAEHLAQQAEQLGPEADRFLTDVITGERFSTYLPTPDEAKRITTLAADVIDMFAEQRGLKQQLGLLAPGGGVEDYLPRYQLRHMLEEGERLQPVTRTGTPTAPRQRAEHGRTLGAEQIAERDYLGEIREASFAIRHGGARGGTQIANTKLLQALDQLPGSLHPQYSVRQQAVAMAHQAYLQARAAGNPAAQQLSQLYKQAVGDLRSWSRSFRYNANWKKLPESTALGPLSGAVVQREVADYVIGTPVQRTVYDHMLRAWKTAKTAYNLPTHVGNFMSNVYLAHMAGVPIWRLPKMLVEAARDVKTYGDATQYLMERGVLNHNILTAEAQGASTDVFAGAAERLERELRILMRTTRPATEKVLKEFGFEAQPLPSNLVNQATKAHKKVTGLYSNEDNWFRIAVYKQKLSEGWTQEQAANYAKWSLVDYDTKSPALAFARRWMFPFILFPAKALPMVLTQAADHPIRFLTAAALFAAGAEALQQQFPEVTAQDVPADIRKPTFGYLLPQMLPVGVGDRGQRYFADVTRLTPFSALTTNAPPGTVLGQTLPNLPLAAMQPSGPLMDVASLALNRDPYSGRPILRPGERTDPLATAGKAAGYLAQRAMPPMAGFHAPRLYADVREGRMGDLGVDALGLVGARPRIIPKGEAQRRAEARYNETVRDIETNFRFQRQRARNSPERLDALKRTYQERMLAALERFRHELRP